MTPGSTAARRVLLVDDEEKFCAIAKEFLTGRGYAVETACTGEEALALMEQFGPEVIVTDLIMPGLSGLELLKLARERPFPARIIIVTASDAEAVAQEAMQEGAQAFMCKPVDLNALERLISGIWPAQAQPGGGT